MFLWVLALILLATIGVYLYALYDNTEVKKLRDRNKELEKEIKQLANKLLIEGEDIKVVVENKKSLTELLKTEAEDKDYEEYVEKLVTWIKELYKDYKFQLLKPTVDDLKSGYAVMFQLYSVEKPAMFEDLFKLAIDRGLSDEGINKKFMEFVKAGKVLDLGDAIISIEGTGSSSILRGEDLQIFISYETEEYKEARVEYEEEEKAKFEERKEKQEQYRKQQEETYKILTEAAVVLKQMTTKQLEENPEFIEQYEEVQKLYK